jgi:hypothetical protein
MLFLALLLLAAPLRAEDLSERLEALEREAASRPAPVAEPTAPAPPAAPAAAPIQSRFNEIQQRRARAHRERAAAAAQRAAKLEGSPSASAAERERDLYAKKAEDVFRAGTAEYQAAYDEWLASEPAP